MCLRLKSAGKIVRISHVQYSTLRCVYVHCGNVRCSQQMHGLEELQCLLGRLSGLQAFFRIVVYGPQLPCCPQLFAPSNCNYSS